MHTGGRGLSFMEQYTTDSSVAVSGAAGSGFAGAASAQFGATTKSQFIQAEGID